MTNEEPLEPRKSGLAAGWTVQPETVSEPEAQPAEMTAGEDPTSAFSSYALMLLGVFGGLYLLYTWGWFEVARAYAAMNTITAGASGIIGGVLQHIIFWIAPLAPLAWFAVSYVLTKHRGMLALFLALLGGAIVLLPLPMIFGGSAQ